MKIAIFSDMENKVNGTGWYRGGEEISYYRNGMYKYVKERKRYLSSLSFVYKGNYDDDTIYFAYSVPYTYTQLMRELNEFDKNESKYKYVNII